MWSRFRPWGIPCWPRCFQSSLSETGPAITWRSGSAWIPLRSMSSRISRKRWRNKMEAKGVIVILGIVVVLILAGCQKKIICKSPYLLVGQECCLDKDANGICDKDEQSAEPKTVVVSKPEVIEVQKYVCSDGKIVSNPKDCPVEKPATEKEMSLPALITTNEEDTVILNFSVSPACKSGENGGEVFFKLGSIPEKVWLQARQGNDAYSTIFTREGVYEKYLSFVICDG